MKYFRIFLTLIFLLIHFTSAYDLQHESIVTKLKYPKNSSSFNKIEEINKIFSRKCENDNLYRRIVDGHSALSCQFPFVAELVVKFESERQGTCTGSLVAPKWILTAKHCLFNFDDPVTTVIAIMGSINRRNKTNQQIRMVKNVVRLKYLTLPDIALAELEDDFHLNNFVNIINLPKVVNYKPGLEFIGVGWGKINSHNYSDVLQYASFKIHDTEECKNDVGIWSQFAFCSKGLNQNSSILSGDSGGPALIYNNQNKPVLIGINVATKQDSHGNIIWHLTTKIEPYLSWINQHINHQ